MNAIERVLLARKEPDEVNVRELINRLAVAERQRDRWQELAEERLRVFEESMATPAGTAQVTLAPEEYQILVGVVKGLTDVQMARLLGISHDAAAKRAERLKRRIGANNRAHMVTRGFELGLLHIERRAER